MIRTALAVLLLTAAAVAGTAAPPNFAGKWKLDVVRSTGDTTRNGTIVINQNGNALEFNYYTGVESAGTDVFVTDGHQRERYRTRLGTAYTRARWEKGALLITTTTALNNEGTQTYDDSERWSLSKDGQVLSMKSSDGKVLIYTKVIETPPASDQH